MALNKGENAGTIFLSVSNGKLVRQFKEATKETVQRVNKMGKTVHEEFYKDLTGIISKIETKENDYGKQWQITFLDGEEKYMIQMSYSGRYSSSFLKALPNVDKLKPVRFMPWQFKTEDGKDLSGVTLYQDYGFGPSKVLPAYSKEEPNGLPEMKQVKIKGKITWDDDDMMKFLEAMAVAWIGAAIEEKRIEGESEGAPKKAPF